MTRWEQGATSSLEASKSQNFYRYERPRGHQRGGRNMGGEVRNGNQRRDGRRFAPPRVGRQHGGNGYKRFEH